jgi:hypothetical protein
MKLLLKTIQATAGLAYWVAGAVFSWCGFCYLLIGLDTGKWAKGELFQHGWQDLLLALLVSIIAGWLFLSVEECLDKANEREETI